MTASEDPIRIPAVPDAMARGGVAPDWTELLALLAPGVVHQLGNVMFTIQGHAQLGAGAAMEHDAILRAARRGSETVRLLRALLGDAVPIPVGLDTLLEQVAELVRVSLREQGRQLQLLPSEHPGANWNVDLHTTAPLLLLALQQFALALPPVASVLTMRRCGAANESPRVRLAYVCGEGQLPFPLAGADLLSAIAAAAKRRGVQVVVRLRDAGLELSLPFARGPAPSSIVPTEA